MSWKILLLLSYCMPYLWSAVDNFFLVPYHLWTLGIFLKWVEKIYFFCPTACHIYGVQWDLFFFNSASSLDLGHFFKMSWKILLLLSHCMPYFLEMSWKILLLFSHCTPYLWSAVESFFLCSISSLELGHFSKMSWKIMLLLSHCMPYLWSVVGLFFFFHIISGLRSFFKNELKNSTFSVPLLTIFLVCSGTIFF